jgi:hypothetical protein
MADVSTVPKPIKPGHEQSYSDLGGYECLPECLACKEAQRRKQSPMYSGLIAYFPDALEEVSHVSFVGNLQHNPGQPLHWAKEKSTDEPDCLIRHLTDHARGDKFDSDGVRHLAKAAWRSLANLQRDIDKEKSNGTSGG